MAGAVGGGVGTAVDDKLTGRAITPANVAQGALEGVAGAYLFGSAMAAADPGQLIIFEAPNRSFPTIMFTHGETPGIAANIETAQELGAPGMLSRTTSRSAIRANRRAALRGQTAPGSGLSLDEYPFASSYEGGSGARVAAVAVHEQNVQGGKLSAFYQEHSITDGDWFHVEVRP